MGSAEKACGFTLVVWAHWARGGLSASALTSSSLDRGLHWAEVGSIGTPWARGFRTCLAGGREWVAAVHNLALFLVWPLCLTALGCWDPSLWRLVTVKGRVCGPLAP